MKKAFSLVELSIVLIIIGLLVAGVSSGSKLIHQAKISTIITEITDIKNSTKAFEIVYEQLPGDFDNAEGFWGTYNSSTNPTGTVNGNDDNVIVLGNEGYRAWHHLSLADVYSGGFSSGSTSAFVIGTNVVESGYSGGVYGIIGGVRNGYRANYIRFGVISGVNNNAGIVSALDAYKIEKKMDDGDPSRGTVRTNASGYVNDNAKPNGTVCINGNFTESDLSFVFASTGAVCVMDFEI